MMFADNATVGVEEVIWLIIGTFLVSGGLTYACWVRLRVMFLRQDIYDARDRLFDLAADEGALSDPGYVAFRERLNILARTADAISFPLIVYALATTQYPPAAIPESSNHKIRDEIEKITIELGGRIQRYLYWETAAGWVLVVVLGLVQLKEFAEDQSRKGAVAWVRSDMPRGLMPARR